MRAAKEEDMAKTRDYMDYLDDNVKMAPATSQEEYQAAETIANVLRDHKLETSIEEFDAHPWGTVIPSVIVLIMFVCLIVAKFTTGPARMLTLLAALLVAGLTIFIHYTGSDILRNLGPAVSSQNVVGIHRATGSKVVKGARPIVIVAHYDTPRVNFLRSGHLARYQSVLRMVSIFCHMAAAVTVVFQLFPFVPEVLQTIMWVIGLVAMLPLLVLAVSDIYSRLSPYTAGSNDNKASVAALLAIANKVRPMADRVDDDIEKAGPDRARRRRAKDAPPAPPAPQRVEIMEEVKGVRHGAAVLESLGILPSDCEIIYEEPRIQIVEQTAVDVLSESSSAADEVGKFDTEASEDESMESDTASMEQVEDADDEENETFVYSDEEESSVDESGDQENGDSSQDDAESYDEEEEEYQDDYEDEVEEYDEEEYEEYEDEEEDEDDYDEEYEESEEDSYEETEDEDDYQESSLSPASAIASVGSWFKDRVANVKELLSKRSEHSEEEYSDEDYEEDYDGDDEEEYEDYDEDDTEEYEEDEAYDEDDVEEDEQLEDDEEPYDDDTPHDEGESYDEDESSDEEEPYDDEAYEEDGDTDSDDLEEEFYEDDYEEEEFDEEEYDEEEETVEAEDESEEVAEYGDEDESAEEHIEEGQEEFAYDDDAYTEDDYDDDEPAGEDEYEDEEYDEADDDEDYDDEDYEEEDYEEVEDSAPKQTIGNRIANLFRKIRIREADISDSTQDDGADERLSKYGYPEPYEEDLKEKEVFEEAYDESDLYDESYDEEAYDSYDSASSEEIQYDYVETEPSDSYYPEDYEEDFDYEDAYTPDDDLNEAPDDEAAEDDAITEEEEKSTERLVDPNELHIDREEDADILPKDTTGIDIISDSYDLYTVEMVQSGYEKPAPLTDPGWGVSSYQPALPSVNIARRAALFDLPDPSSLSPDPFDDYEEYDDEYDEYEDVEIPVDEPSVLENPTAAEIVERADVSTPYEGEKFEKETVVESIPGTEESANEDSDDSNKSSGKKSFWGSASQWKGGATVRDDLRGDDAPIVIDADDLQDAILELGDEFLVAHDIWFVATGASEINHAGIQAFLENHKRDIRGAFLVNLECIGAGELSVIVQEGFSASRRADRRLVRMITSIAQDLHIQIVNALLNWGETDSATAMRSRVRSVTIAGLDENVLPAYSHTSDDIPENVNPKQVYDVVRMVTELIRRA